MLGFAFIPGLAMLLTVARATSSGTKVGIATGAGIAAGDVIHTFMVIVGISAVIATSALCFLAFLPQFVNPANGSVVLQLTVLGVVFVLLGLVSTVVFAVSAGTLGRFLRRNPIVLKWQKRIAGGIFCGLGVRLAIQEQ